ncbi:hypothetical protein ACWATR_40010, partial [Nostoc sp. UIC 10890]
VKGQQFRSQRCLYQYLEKKKPTLPDDAPITVVLFVGGEVEAGMIVKHICTLLYYRQSYKLVIISTVGCSNWALASF